MFKLYVALTELNTYEEACSRKFKLLFVVGTIDFLAVYTRYDQPWIGSQYSYYPKYEAMYTWSPTIYTNSVKAVIEYFFKS